MIVFTCGGTGGHITPAIYIANQLKSDYMFIGGNRIEKQLLKSYNFNEISTSRKNVFKIVSGIFQAYKLLKKNKVSAVFSTGGYVTLPVGIAAVLANIPLILLEQNSVPGKTNSFLARFSALIFTGYPNMDKYFSKKKTLYSGNPIENNRGKIKKKEKRNKLLITGGSQGAQQINRIILELLPLLKNIKLEIIWSTGKNNYKEVLHSLQGYVDEKQKIIYHGIHIHLHPYIDDLSRLLPEVKIAISRAGAMSIAELIGNEIPAIYIPYPYATHNHQHENAQFVRDTNAGILLNESEVQPTIIFQMINKLQNNYELYLENLNKLKSETAIDIIIKNLSEKGYL